MCVFGRLHELLSLRRRLVLVLPFGLLLNPVVGGPLELSRMVGRESCPEPPARHIEKCRLAVFFFFLAPRRRGCAASFHSGGGKLRPGGVQPTVAVEMAPAHRIVLTALRIDPVARLAQDLAHPCRRNSGLTERISATIPAAPGHALEVPPKRFV